MRRRCRPLAVRAGPQHPCVRPLDFKRAVHFYSRRFQKNFQPFAIKARAYAEFAARNGLVNEFGDNRLLDRWAMVITDSLRDCERVDNVSRHNHVVEPQTGK